MSSDIFNAHVLRRLIVTLHVLAVACVTDVQYLMYVYIHINGSFEH